AAIVAEARRQGRDPVDRRLYDDLLVGRLQRLPAAQGGLHLALSPVTETKHGALRKAPSAFYGLISSRTGGIMAKKSKKNSFKKHVAFGGRMVMIGFGSIGQGVLPLIFRHIDMQPEQLTVISPEDRGGEKELKKFGVTFVKRRLTQDNLRQTLDKRV